MESLSEDWLHYNIILYQYEIFRNIWEESTQVWDRTVVSSHVESNEHTAHMSVYSLGKIKQWKYSVHTWRQRFSLLFWTFRILAWFFLYFKYISCDFKTSFSSWNMAVSNVLKIIKHSSQYTINYEQCCNLAGLRSQVTEG